MTAFGYRDVVTGAEHLALVHGDLGNGQSVLTRVHSECLTGDVLGAVDGDPVAVRREVAARGGQPGLRHPQHVVLVAPAVVDQLLDRDHRQAVLVGEVAQLLAALHGAVVVDDLGDHSGRFEPGEPGQVHGRLGVTGPHEHPALGVPQREHVPRLHDLERLRRGVDQGAHRVRAVGGRDAGGDAVARVDGHGVRRPHPFAVAVSYTH